MSRAPGLLALACAGVAIAGGAWLVGFLTSPESPLLIGEGGAAWIRADRPSRHEARFRPMGAVRFRRAFELERVPDEATLYLRAYRSHSVVLNGVEVAARSDPSAWNRTERVDLSPALRVGRNTLTVEVENPRGPPALLAYAPALSLATDATWTTSMWGGAFEPAALTSQHPILSISRAFPSPARSLARVAPLLALLFLVGALANRYAPIRPVHVRWLLLGAFGLLCARDLLVLPPGVGMDVREHLAYVAHIAKTGRLPLASDGWQMFQSPLLYLLATPLYLALGEGRSADELLVALRVVPMLCGLAQIEICWRAARLLLPGRDGLQIVALVAGGLLPINLYSAQVLGNEPLAGALTALCVLLAARMLVDRALPAPTAQALALGAAYGLALLAKVSPIVLLPLLLAAIGVHARRRGLGPGTAARMAGAFAIAAVAVCGWYYARNWLALGRPFVGGWDPVRGIAWWQDPGYRVPEDLLGFGAALTRPVYAATAGFWDGLYAGLWMDSFLSGVAIASVAPPWRMALLLAMPLLSTPMALALVVGAVRCVRGRAAGRSRADPDADAGDDAGADAGAPGDAERFAVAAVAVYWAAMAALFLAVPAYSSVKATYSLGVLPCYGILIARGFEPLARHRTAWTAACGLLAAWAGASYLGYLA